MSEMIDRVENALAMFLQPTQNLQIGKAAARAAIAAMREPTDEMLFAPTKWGPAGDRMLLEHWRAMIDAALVEKA